MISNSKAISGSVGGEAASFPKVWLPSFLVFFAFGLSTFGLNWFIARAPGAGGGTLGITVGVSSIVATVIVVLFAGMVDRINRVTFLLCVQVLLLAEILFLLIPYTGKGAGLGSVLLAAITYILLESTQGLYQAALETTAADLASRSWPSNRTALMLQLQAQVTRFAAPIVGGSLLSLGLLWTMPIVSGIAILVTTGLLLLWARTMPSRQSAPGAGEDQEKSWLALRTMVTDGRAAAGWIATQPVLIFMLIVGVLNNLVVFPFYTLLPAFLAELRLENEAALYGQFTEAYGAGMLITSTLLMSFARGIRRPGTIAAGLVLLISVVVGVITVVRDPVILVAASAVVGMLFMILVAVGGGVWLDLTPSEVRVRVFSLRRLVTFASIPLGSSLMGLGGATVGFVPFLRILLVIVAVGIVAAVVLCRGWSQEVGQLEEET